MNGMEHLICQAVEVAGGLLLVFGYLIYRKNKAETWACLALLFFGIGAVIFGVFGILLHHNPFGLSHYQFLRATSFRASIGGTAIGLFIALLLAGQIQKLGQRQGAEEIRTPTGMAVIMNAIGMILVGIVGVLLSVCVVAILISGCRTACEDPFITDIKQASQTLHHDQSDIVAYLQRADAYYELRKYDKADMDYTKAIQFGVKRCAVYLKRGKCLNAMGSNQAALKDLLRAKEISPASSQCYHRLADAYRDQGKDKEALAAYKQGLELDPKNAPLHACQAWMYQRKGDLVAAEQGFNTAIALDPGYTYAYYGRGQLFVAMGEHAKAVDDFTKVLEAEPTCFLQRIQPEVYLARNISARKAGRSGYDFDLIKALFQKIRLMNIDRRIEAAEQN